MDEAMTYPQRVKYPHMAKLIGLAKGAGIVPATLSPELECFGGLVQDNEVVWKRIIDMYDIEGFIDEKTGELDITGMTFVRRLLARSIETSQRVIDFDDQLYMPVIAQVPFEKFDVVLLDEAQDVNAMQIEIVTRLLAPGGRVIAVGDRHQAIYGFRGAMSQSMDHIGDLFKCQPLPLSVSYRCPKKVIDVAQQYVKHIEAFEGAVDGLVERHDGDEGYDIRLLRQQDVILCRLNAPLVSLAFALIRQKVACRVLGRDIANGLVALVKRLKAHSVEELLTALSAYLKRDAIRHEKDPAALSRSQDKVSTLHVFIDELAPTDTVQRLIFNIEGMFQDVQPGQQAQMLTLSTVHKAKGLEWDRVFILDAAELMPLPWARPGWQQDQEFNLIYVAVTRAKRELRFISSIGLGIPKADEEETEAIDASSS
jgi:DNA helicase II / ATP-dependent DNA helicase PcrA